MPTVSSSAELAVAPDRVWALVSDFSRYGEWNVAHTAFPDGPPELTTGTTYREDLRIMGMPGQVRWTIAEFDAPKLLRLNGTGPMGVTLEQVLSISATAAGATVNLETSFDGGPIAGPIGAAVAQAGQRAATESLQKLSGLM